MAFIILEGEGQGASAGQPGQLDTVYGLATPGDTINLGNGKVVLDSSFGLGGDIIRFPGYAWHYSVELVGSRIVVSSAAGAMISIPLGVNATFLDFRGDDTRAMQIVDGKASIGGQTVDTGTILLRPAPEGTTGPQLTGGEGDELLNGDAADNHISGGGGDDLLLGYAGSDTLLGGDGADTLNGGPNRDLLTGGTGADIFIFGHAESTPTNIGGVQTYDRITDFQDGTDLLRILAPSGSGVPGGIVRVVDGGNASSETSLVDTLETLATARYTNGADALVFTVAGQGVGVLVDSNANDVLDADDVFFWIENPAAVITAADFA